MISGLFVLRKSLWAARCRRTRQIVAFVRGDRSQKTGRCRWNKIPDEYKRCLSFSNFLEVYQKVFPKRKTFSFSKSNAFRRRIVKWYISAYKPGYIAYNVTTLPARLGMGMRRLPGWGLVNVHNFPRTLLPDHDAALIVRSYLHPVRGSRAD